MNRPNIVLTKPAIANANSAFQARESPSGLVICQTQVIKPTIKIVGVGSLVQPKSLLQRLIGDRGPKPAA